MEFKVPYSAMPRVQFETVGPSLTRQSSKRECDVNRIMERFEKTGVLDHHNQFQGAYGDFTNTPQDYHETVNQVIEANDMFMSLPSKIRKTFGNDPAQFVEFVADPDNGPQLVKMGLAETLDPIQEVIDRSTPPKPSTPPKEAPKAPEKGAKIDKD